MLSTSHVREIYCMVAEMEREGRLRRINKHDWLRMAQETDENRPTGLTCAMHEYPKCDSL